ncbi:MAG: DNA repair protein RecO [Catonella sp.]|uniref:DNA repair protein RecO n=1 Tax=Catonella sp. TaxID=2382125 RepID=UPI003FA038C1
MTDEIEVSGVVVSGMPIGEYDKRIVIITRELGKIHAFVRGARRTNSKLLAGTDPLTFGKFKLVTGRNAYTLTEVKIVNYFEDLKMDIERVYYGYYFLELASYFSRENIVEKALINLIYIAFKALEAKMETLTPDFIKAIFEWKIFAIEGIMPGIDGGVLLGKRLRPSTAYAIKTVSNGNLEKIFSFDLEAESKKEFIQLAKEYRDLNTDISFKSLEMIREV